MLCCDVMVAILYRNTNICCRKRWMHTEDTVQNEIGCGRARARARAARIINDTLFTKGACVGMLAAMICLVLAFLRSDKAMLFRGRWSDVT